MTLVWMPATAISGDGQTALVGHQVRLVLDTLPAWQGHTSNTPWRLYRPGVAGFGQATYRSAPVSLTWEQQVLVPEGDSSDTVWWQLASGVSGTLQQGVEVTDVPLVAVHVARTTVLSQANGIWTAVPWQSVVRDPYGMVNLATQPTRITVPIAGWWAVVGHLGWDANASGRRLGDVLRNGASITAYTGYDAVGAVPTYMDVSAVVYCAAGDYLEVTQYQNCGSPLNSYSLQNAQAWYLGP